MSFSAVGMKVETRRLGRRAAGSDLRAGFLVMGFMSKSSSSGSPLPTPGADLRALFRGRGASMGMRSAFVLIRAAGRGCFAGRDKGVGAAGRSAMTITSSERISWGSERAKSLRISGVVRTVSVSH